MALFRRADGRLAPVRTRVLVARPVDYAFEVFAHRIGRWWPLATHSVDAARARRVHLDGRLGGELVEVWDDGTEHGWATVVGWREPAGLALAWALHGGAGTTEVDVRFTPAGTSSTWLDLEHRGWAALGEAAPAARASYEAGWPTVLAAYLAAM